MTETNRTRAEDGVERVSGVTTALKEHPLLALSCATIVGAALGGAMLKRSGRLAFLAGCGFALAELWQKQGGFDVRELLDEISKD